MQKKQRVVVMGVVWWPSVDCGAPALLFLF